MRTSILFLFLVLFFIAEVFSYRALHFLVNNKSYALVIKLLYWGFTLLIFALLIYAFANRSQFAEPSFMPFGYVILSLFLINFISKLIFGSFHLLNEISAFGAHQFKPSVSKENLMTRSRFLTMTGLAIASIPFGTLLYGITKGKYQFRVIRQTLQLKNLPSNFVGKTILQLSDMHLGSFPKNTNEIARAIEKINSLQPDYIIFTGDMINERAIEAEHWVPVLKQLKAKHGMYSVLGNHDYGDYYGPWSGNPDKIEQNVLHLKELQKKMGFTLLRNENTKLTLGEQFIELIGLENWGAGRFSKYGDLTKAMQGTDSNNVQLLLSHDPSHWDEQVLGKTNIDVAFAGHTHGAQLGVEAPGFRFSPSQFIYPRWAGLYKEGSQQLYVNRGFGYIGYAGRFGIWPEITLFELQQV